MRIQVIATPDYVSWFSPFTAGWRERHDDDFSLLVFSPFLPSPTPQARQTVRQTSLLPPEPLGTSAASKTPESFDSTAIPDQLTPSRTPATLPRHLNLDWSCDVFFVFSAEVNDSVISNLAQLVASKVARGGGQPVVSLALDTPLSRRQLVQSGLSGCYFRNDHPTRDLQQWGKILAQTWHID